MIDLIKIADSLRGYNPIITIKTDDLVNNLALLVNIDVEKDGVKAGDIFGLSKGLLDSGRYNEYLNERSQEMCERFKYELDNPGKPFIPPPNPFMERIKNLSK